MLLLLVSPLIAFFHPFCVRIYSSGSIAWHIVYSFIFMFLSFFILLKWMHDYSISIYLFFAYCLLYKSVDDHSFLFFFFLFFSFFLYQVLSESVLIISLHTPFFSFLLNYHDHIPTEQFLFQYFCISYVG